MRAIAVLSVIIFHLNNHYLPGGFTGVDIFFVISGFVVSKSIYEKNIQQNIQLKDYYLNFYSSRFLRVLPPLFFMLTVAFALFVLFIPSSWLSATSEKTGLFAYFGLSNFILINLNDGYFSPRTDFNPFTHTWSLGIEEQFYLIFPIIFYFYVKKNTYTSKFFTILILSALTLFSFVYAYYLSNQNENFKSYFFIGSRFWELGLGVIVYLFTTSKFSNNINNKTLMSICVLGLSCLALGFIYSNPAHFPYPWALLPVIGTSLLLIAIAKNVNNNIIISFLNIKLLSFIGKLSYSLYLWHWPIFVLMRWTVGLESFLTYSVALIATVVMAYLSYILIENPIRFNRLLNQKKLFVLILGVLIMGGGYAYSNILLEKRAKLSLSVTKNSYDWYPYPYPTDTRNSSNQFKERTIFLIGNSHSGAYEGMVNELKDQTGAHFKMFTDVCSFGNLLNLQDNSEVCMNKINNALMEIESTGRPGDIVLFASLRLPRLSDQWAKFDVQAAYEATNSKESISRLDKAREEFIPTINRLKSLGFNIVIDAPKPIFASPPYRCSDWFNQMNPICKGGTTIKRDYLLNLREPVVQSLNKIDGIYIWDPFPILCPSSQKECSPFDKNGKPMFFDGDHLSGYGNKILYSDFAKVVGKIWEK